MTHPEELDLVDHQARLVDAIENVQLAFAIFDVEDRFVLCNAVYRSLLGEAIADTVLGRRFEDVYADRVRSGALDLEGAEAEQRIARRMAYRARPVGALEERTSDGHALRVTDRRTAKGGIVTTILDITDDARRERELREARRNADAANAAKSEFLSSMSHELRTPLNAILGFSQLLEADARDPLDERQRMWVGHVLKAGRHLLTLIDEVLDLARIESGGSPLSTERVGLAEVLAEVTTTLGPMATSAGIALSIDTPAAELPSVLADRTRLIQILLNYGSNAIKYNRRGGSARFRVGAVGDVIRVEVADDGIGIPEDSHALVFEPFQRLGQETGPIEGTGIGLALSKRLAELMHGRVGFESGPGRGSEFWVELPPYREAPSLAPIESAGPPRPRRGKRTARILYVEDNPPNVALMQAMLETIDGIELLTAPDGELGIVMARAHRPDLIILDINLPGISGYDALARLRAWPETAKIPALALSASAMDRDRARAADAGFDRYLAKPVQIVELVRALEELLPHDPE